MEINFENIEYLKMGNDRQQFAYHLLTQNNILSNLEKFTPIFVGTIPIHIDIICYFMAKQGFINTITDYFSHEKGFKIIEFNHLDALVIVANFFIDDVEIEIFGQNIPTKLQLAYQHMIIEHKIINKKGEQFRQQIIALKQQGHKTERAFGILLNLKGNPYSELLTYQIE